MYTIYKIYLQYHILVVAQSMLVNSIQQLQIQVSMVETLHHISEHKGQYCHKLVTLTVQLLLVLLRPMHRSNIVTYTYY